MAQFLELLFIEAMSSGVEGGMIEKDTVINKFNEAGVPLTWTRLA